MTKTKKKEMINAFARALKVEMLSNLDKLPDNWNGIELRWYMRYKTQAFCFDDKDLRKRYQDFENAILVKNL